ncbi:MAG: type II secretion system GspH family protein, partial [Planctomycetales bacterium]
MNVSLARFRHSRQGFTIVELIVVVTIILILMALLMPAIRRVMVTAKNAEIQMEIDQLSIALDRYKSQRGEYPPSMQDHTYWWKVSQPNLERHVARAFPQFVFPTYPPPPGQRYLRICWARRGTGLR